MSPQTVLIVEDEPLLRLNAVSLIEDIGCLPLECGTADEAIALLEANSRIRIVFTDINLVGSTMDGLRLAAVIRDRWPPVELIVTSGMFAKIPANKLPHGARFLSKPYTPHQLQQTINGFPGGD